MNQPTAFIVTTFTLTVNHPSPLFHHLPWTLFCPYSDPLFKMDVPLNRKGVIFTVQLRLSFATDTGKTFGPLPAILV